MSLEAIMLFAVLIGMIGLGAYYCILIARSAAAEPQYQPGGRGNCAHCGIPHLGICEAMPQPPSAGFEEKQLEYNLKDGAAWNPLTQFPRNLPCFCGSGVKSKHCCLPKAKRAMNEEDAGRIRDNWDDIIAGRLKVAQQKPGNGGARQSEGQP